MTSKASQIANLAIYMFFCRLFQVTWLTNYGFIYDRKNLSKVCAFPLFLSKYVYRYIIFIILFIKLIYKEMNKKTEDSLNSVII